MATPGRRWHDQRRVPLWRTGKCQTSMNWSSKTGVLKLTVKLSFKLFSLIFKALIPIVNLANILWAVFSYESFTHILKFGLITFWWKKLFRKEPFKRKWNWLQDLLGNRVFSGPVSWFDSTVKLGYNGLNKTIVQILDFFVGYNRDLCYFSTL